MKQLSAITILIGLSLSCMAKWPIPDEPLTHQPKPEISASNRLAQIAEDFWQQLLRRSPTWATFLGDRRFDADLPDISEQAIEAEHRALTSLLGDIQKIDRSQLNTQEQMTADVLEHELVGRIDCAQCKTWLWVVDQLDGPQVTFAEMPNYHTIRSLDDAQNLVARYQKMKIYYDQHVTNLKRGRALGYTSSQINIEQVIRQVDWQLRQDPQKSPYFEVAEKLPDTLSPEQKNEIKERVLASITEFVFPALTSYRDFLKDDLLKSARRDASVSSIPQGRACYQALVHQHTGLRQSPDDIHQLGLNEVARIKKEMTALAQSAKNSTLNAYIKHLREERGQHLDSKEDLLAYNQKLVTKAQNALPRAFGRLPKTPIEVKSIEAFREKEAPAAYYYEAPSDGTRPAFYYLNTFQPRERSLYNMAVLAFHEALPGHHLQIALANENKLLPEFQRQLGQTAFVEGWALYAEGLAGELGLYETTAEKLGALNYELWRALRLVIDTGIHHKRWSREKALRYLAEQTALSKIEVANEIDRYIVWPGQALAYKIGQLEIASLRREAQQKLGSRFSLTAFHDRLLAFGALPLPSMRRNIEKWVKEQEISSSGSGFVLMP